MREKERERGFINFDPFLQDTCVNLSKLVQESAKSNVNLLLSVSDDSSQEDTEDSMEITKLSLVSFTYNIQLAPIINYMLACIILMIFC